MSNSQPSRVEWLYERVEITHHSPCHSSAPPAAAGAAFSLLWLYMNLRRTYTPTAITAFTADTATTSVLEAALLGGPFGAAGPSGPGLPGGPGLPYLPTGPSTPCLPSRPLFPGGPICP